MNVYAWLMDAEKWEIYRLNIQLWDAPEIAFKFEIQSLL